MKEDFRIIKTKNKLKKALLELLEQETFEKINVTKICLKAQVNRVTFYSHYQDKYDLFQKCLEDFKVKIMQSISKVSFNNLNSIDAFLYVTKIIFKRVIDEIFEYKNLIKKFRNQENSILNYIIETTSYQFLEEINQNLDPYLQFKYNKDHILSFLIGGTNKMIYDWIERDKMKHIEEFKNDLNLFLTELFHSKILFKEKDIEK
ncbi:MAG: TetR/AcrR family transcriptional regulator [Anaeroplasmataceae bacterium]|nr:TetR/AcrR family transcriptional regulator [Anaeroplasmataceae bacterium]